MQCGTVNAWFGDVGVDHVNTAECAGVGECSHSNGTCMYGVEYIFYLICECSAYQVILNFNTIYRNCGGQYGVFSGSSCQYLGCYNNSNSGLCR